MGRKKIPMKLNESGILKKFIKLTGWYIVIYNDSLSALNEAGDGKKCPKIKRSSTPHSITEKKWILLLCLIDSIACAFIAIGEAFFWPSEIAPQYIAHAVASNDVVWPFASDNCTQCISIVLLFLLFEIKQPEFSNQFS